jgi:hypothetical protein
MYREKMPRSWCDIAVAVWPWAACLLVALALFALLCGCGSSNGRPAEEHVAHYRDMTPLGAPGRAL